MNQELKKLIVANTAILQDSPQDMASVYAIICGNGERIFAECSDGYRIRKYTYTDIANMVERVSAGIHARIGATHGYVGLEMENSIEWIVAFWAILRSGNKPFLINCRHPKTLADRLLKQLQVQYVIGTQPTTLDAQWLDYASLQSEEPVEAEFEDEFALSTSATSLQAKICIYHGKQVAAQILNSRRIVRDCYRMANHYHGFLKQLAFLPFYHVFGLFAVYFWFAFFGRTFVFLRDMAPDTILKTCRKHEVTHIFAVPMLWHTIEDKIKKQLEQKGEKTQKKFEKGMKISMALQKTMPHLGTAIAKKLMREITDAVFGPSIQFCISGGSYLRSSALHLINGIGYPLHNGYGMSEIGITSVELGVKITDRNRNSIGKPFESVEYRLGEDGTLFVRGRSLCRTVMIDGEETEMPEWFDTGDLMSCEEGRYYISGRRGDVVIGESGENINPDLIEQHFGLSGDTPYSVLGLKEEDNDVLSMVVRINPYMSEGRRRQLVERIYADNEKLPMAMRVRKFYFTTDAIAPETAIKVGRKYLLRAIDEGTVRLTPFSQFGQQQDGQSDEAHNPLLVARLREIVAESLCVAADTVDDRAHILLDMGATSLQYFEIISAIAAEFSIQSYNDKDHYRYTVEEFCEYIERYV
ncbi:MAG: AMP-binding protein [Clostridia bacterium]|nr:AMP-binding protein [Clostridia bacterium]